MSELTVMNQQHPSTMSASSAIFNVQALGQLTAFAELMASSTVTVPAHFVGKPSDCMAVVMQAMQWGMNPYAVAQKTYLVNGVLGYEAQLVNAVVTSSTAIHGRFHYKYEGDWSRCTKSREVVEKKPALAEIMKLQSAFVIGVTKMSRGCQFKLAQSFAAKLK